MQKVLHFDSPVEVYQADACGISCYDARFDLAIRKFLKRRGLGLVDHLKIPGGAKAFGAPLKEPDRDFALRGVRISLTLHNPKLALIIGHADCGAYAGAPNEQVITDLIRAAEVVRAAEPSLAVETFFADFDGIYSVD